MFARSIHKNISAIARPTSDGTMSFCHIDGCSRSIPRGYRMMCDEHWSEVPPELCAQVARAWAAWMAGELTVQPYLIARLTAIIHVSRLHNIDVTRQIERLAQRRAELSRSTVTSKLAATS
jgi:hypothetical protein